MLPNFDVFKTTKDGLRWCSEADSLTDAKAKALQLNDNDTEFVILNQETQEQIRYKPESQRSQK